MSNPHSVYVGTSDRRRKDQPLNGGERFGRLVAQHFSHLSSRGQRMWVFACDCGGTVTTRCSSVIRQGVTSCGCLRVERVKVSSRKHGGIADHPVEHRTWAAMMRRCRDPKNKAFARYGGRGITVCDRWSEFANFLADMGPRPTGRYSLDRIDNDKGYSPENCRWALFEVQGNNRSSNRKVVIDGVEMTVAQASRASGISPELAKMRLDKGWNVEQAFRPARTYKRSV